MEFKSCTYTVRDFFSLVRGTGRERWKGAHSRKFWNFPRFLRGMKRHFSNLLRVFLDIWGPLFGPRFWNRSKISRNKVFDESFLHMGAYMVKKVPVYRTVYLMKDPLRVWKIKLGFLLHVDVQLNEKWTNTQIGYIFIPFFINCCSRCYINKQTSYIYFPNPLNQFQVFLLLFFF